MKFVNLLKLFVKSMVLSQSKLDHSILLNYFRAYTVFLLLLCMTTGFIYGIMIRSLREEIIKANSILLMNTIESIEKEFAVLDDLVLLINSNPRIINYANIQNSHFSPEANYKAYEVLKDLATYVRGNSFIEDIYIFFNNENVITSSYRAEKMFYFKYLNKYNNFSLDLLNKYSYKNIVYNKVKGENDVRIYYINSIPIGNKSNPKAIVIFKINSSVIKSFIRNNQFTEKTEITIFNNKKDPIIKYNVNSEHIDNSNLIKVTVSSPILNWEITAKTPKTEFEANLMSIRSTIMVILILALIIGTIIALYFSHINCKPIVNLIKILNKGETNSINGKIFENIENNIIRTINENKALKQKIEKQAKLVTNSVLEKLLRHEFDDEKEVDEIIEMLNIELKSSKFVVCSIKLFISENYKINYSIIINDLKELIEREQKGYVFYINEVNISMLIEVINEQNFNPTEFGRKIIQILNKHNVNSMVGIGSYCNSIREINKSYKEALLSLNVLSKGKGEVILYDSIKHLNETKTKYYYPIKVEQEIINSVKAGDIKKVEKILEEIYNENFKEIQLSGQISRILIYNIISTVIKIMGELGLDLDKFEDAKALHQLFQAEKVNDVYDALISVYSVICDFVNHNKKSKNKYLFEKIKKYLDREYTNSELSLESVAREFNLSASYLSRFFKEQSGVNFNDYIQRLRIEKAKEIFMQNENILVQDVAYKVGYNNSGALIRAFIKYEGITPGEYKCRC